MRMSSIIEEKTFQPSLKIVKQVADAKGVAPTELSPLYETIDSGALDTLLESEMEAGEGTRHIRFQYEGYTVVADSDGQIDLATDDH